MGLELDQNISYGLNIGYAYSKIVVIDASGREHPPIIFPSTIARAEGRSAGAIDSAPMVEFGGKHWWVGEDAELGTPITMVGHERLTDPTFLPVLAISAYRRAGLVQTGARPYCVTGLPGSWSEDESLTKELYNRIKEGLPGLFSKIVVIAEPEALALSQLLDNDGQEVGDARLRDGRGLILDLGGHTDDVSVLHRRRKVRGSTRTFQTGMIRALAQIRNRLAAKFDREFTIHETDAAVRAGYVVLGGGRRADLPQGWDTPILELADELVARLRTDYGNGANLDYALMGGGGALEDRKVEAIRRIYPFATVVDDPQMGVARGYARLGRLRLRQQMTAAAS